jgi:hypothetical protein
MTNKTLLVVEEGGFGDSIQSLCFVPGLIPRTGRTVLMVKPELVTFVRYNFGDIAEVVATECDVAGGYDRYVWSSTLPSLFDGLPVFAPLSAPEPVRRPAGHSVNRRFGLCWACAVPGSLRSVADFATLSPLFDIPGIDWYSLQVGDRTADADGCPALRQPEIALESFENTANFISSLDYVVSVDTAVCHLAGRIDVPTFLLLRYAADWRWGLNDTTAWYPSMRLIRQRSPGDWASAVTQLGDTLHSLGVRSRVSA